MGLFDNVAIHLDHKTHTYYHNKTDEKFTSVSKLLEKFKNKFDKAMMLPLSAKKMLRESGNATPTKLQLDMAVKILDKQWADKNKMACDVGTRIHDALDLYGKTTRIDDKDLEPMIRAVYHYFREYKETYLEQRLHSLFYEVGGTSDRIDVRPNTKNVIDISDYKTNISSPIQFSSKYKQWLKYPLDYLEECSYNVYALQLSVYALMAETDFGCKIGKLQIVYIPPSDPLAFKVIPCVYMRDAAHQILKSNLDENVFKREAMEA